jgi:hypothetical protein
VVVLRIQVFWDGCHVAACVVPRVSKDCGAFVFRLQQPEKNDCLSVENEGMFF